jgi:hypothetical protein
VLLLQVYQKKFVERGADGVSVSVSPHGLLASAELCSFVMMCYGAVTLLACWVFVAVADILGVETFEMPPTEALHLLALNTVLDTVYTGLLLFGIAVASPLLMAVGCMLVMPVSMAVDHVYNGVRLAPVALVGAFLIVVAFSMLSCSGRGHHGSHVHKSRRWSEELGGLLNCCAVFVVVACGGAAASVYRRFRCC